MEGKRICVSQGVVDLKVDDCWLLVDTTSGWVFLLNESGSCVWEVLRRQGDWRDLAAAIARHTGWEQEQVEAEVEVFVAQLAQKGLIEFEVERSPSPAPPPSVLLPSKYARPEIQVALPLEMRAGTPLSRTSDPDPLLDPANPLNPFHPIHGKTKGKHW